MERSSWNGSVVTSTVVACRASNSGAASATFWYVGVAPRLQNVTQRHAVVVQVGGAGLGFRVDVALLLATGDHYQAAVLGLVVEQLQGLVEPCRQVG